MNKNYNEIISSLEKMKIEKTSKTANTDEFAFAYFPANLATTFGNTLRRILLSSIPGWAIAAVRISGEEKTISSEYETLTGIRETPSYLILNLKKLVLQGDSLISPDLENNEISSTYQEAIATPPAYEASDDLPTYEQLEIENQSSSEKPIEKDRFITLKINVDNSQSEEEHKVYGKDVTGDLKIINPEIYLTTISPHSRLEIDLFCHYDYGSYSAARESNELLSKETNIIPLSVDYCPVKEVSLQVVSEVTSLDKKEDILKLAITTNGSISPQNSLKEAWTILERISSTVSKNLLI